MADDRAYRIQVLFDPQQGVQRARVPELDIEVEGDTRASAIEKAEQAIEARIEELATSEQGVPKPVDADPLTSTEVTLSLAEPVYRDLAFAARTAGLSPDELASQLLIRALDRVEGRRAPKPKAAAPEEGADEQPRDDQEGQGKKGRGRGRGRGRGKGRREGYNPEIENQANFLAYVRDMEKGGRGRR